MRLDPYGFLLDTNVFILGFLEADGPEAALLAWLEAQPDVILLLSNDLEEQLRRVGRRLQSKDWVGLLLHYLWSTYRIEYIYLSSTEMNEVEILADIPREDIGIYLTALRGRADYLISANHELLREATAKQRKFHCLNAAEFLKTFGVA